MRTINQTEKFDSPFHHFRALVDRFRGQDLSSEEFLEALDRCDETLQILYEGVAAEPGLFEVEDDPETIVEGQAGIQAFSDASERLRNYAETGDEEIALEALELARIAHERWGELIEVRGDLLSLLESVRIAESGSEEMIEESW